MSLDNILLIPGLVTPPGPKIADPYSAYAPSTWSYGIGTVGDDLYNGVDGAANVRWGAYFQKLNLAEGVYTITQMSARVSFQNDANCDGLAFLVAEKSGSDLIVIANYDLTSQKTSNTSSATATYTMAVNVNIEAGKEYFYALAMRGASGRSSNTPGWRQTTNVAAGEAGEWLGGEGESSIPSTLTVSLSDTTTKAAHTITIQTRNRIVFSGELSSAIIPRRTDGVSTLKIDTFIGDATPTVISLVDVGGGGPTNRLVLDVDHTDEEITFAGAAQALVGQLGDTFDFMMQTNGTAANLLYLNRTDGQGGEGAADIATISHHAKQNNARGGSYTMAAATYRYATISGGGTIGNVQIGWEPVVIFGDSMASYSGRYGQYLPGAFTYPRIHWRAQISGNRLTQTAATFHTAGYLRYKHTTIGLGDLCEMRDNVFCSAGYGLNDISRIGTDAGQVATVTTDYFTRLEEIVDDLLANGNQPLIVGLAPYHHVPNASEQEAQAIISWIAEYADLAVAKQIAWITPWWDLVDRATADDAIPKIRAEYTSDGGTHINATAAQAIVPLIVQSYESGYVGGTWSLNARRFRQVI